MKAILYHANLRKPDPRNIEINTLNDLLELVKENGQLIIDVPVEGSTEENSYFVRQVKSLNPNIDLDREIDIMIYDDFIE